MTEVGKNERRLIVGDSAEMSEYFLERALLTRIYKRTAWNMYNTHVVLNR
jgi:hypothetical protein